MMKKIILIILISLIILIFISCNSDNYVKYSPLIKIEKKGDIIFKEKPILNSKEHKEKIKLLLDFYYKDWKEGENGEILIYKENYEDKELIYNLTLKAKDLEFMNQVKKELKSRPD